MFQQFPYTQIVSVDGLEGKQLAGIPAIAFQYSDRLFMQWDPDGFRLALLCLLRHILQKTVLDVLLLGHPVEITDTATDITVEYENVPDDSQFRAVAQVRVVQDIPLFRCEVERVAVGRLLAAINCIDFVVGILSFSLHQCRNVQKRFMILMTVVLERGLDLWLMSMRGSIKVRILLAEQVLVGDVLPEVVHLPQGDSFNEEREVSIAQ
ncbi:MAG: hypothetical protein L6V80_06595 [Bacteroidales bacterium]|nr:MAG: hypothetical protein L6V80_06595 [Bacteroidales bacterium]